MVVSILFRFDKSRGKKNQRRFERANFVSIHGDAMRSHVRGVSYFPGCTSVIYRQR